MDGFWILLLWILLIVLLILLLIIMRCYFNMILYSNFTFLNLKSVLGKSMRQNVSVTSWRRAYVYPDVNNTRRTHGQKMAPKLERFVSPGKGNGLRARVRIEEGELVYVTEPLAYCVSQKQSRNVCHQCFTRWDGKTFFYTIIWFDCVSCTFPKYMLLFINFVSLFK